MNADSYGDFELANISAEILYNAGMSMSDDEYLFQVLDYIEGNIENMPPAANPPVEEQNRRFAVMNDEEIDELVGQRQSASTKKQTDWSIKQLKLWLMEKGLPVEFEMLPVTELDDLLRRFYAELRTADGKMYSRSTFSGIRSAINRHIRAPPFNRTVSILNNKFHRSNAVFKATLKKMSVDGLDVTKHHETISDGDLRKLRGSEVFHSNDPRALQKRVWFELTLAFARRGCENIQKLKKDAYLFKRDDTGREFVEMKYNEKVKNHQGDEKTKNQKSKPRMYEAKSSENCPVKALKQYLSHLNPDNEYLFQQPRKPENIKNDSIWYTTRPVGEKTIGSFMSSLSQEANLSKRYTNHCVRATTVTKLSHAGVTNRAIARITKHRDERSLQHYEQDSSDAQKRLFSDILNNEYFENTSVPSLSEIPLATIICQVLTATIIIP